MDKTIKNLGAAAAIAATVVGGAAVFDNAFGPKPLSWSEYQSLIQVINYEVKQAGGRMIVTGVNSGLLPAIADQIKNTPVKDDTISLGDQKLSKQEYETARTELLDKAVQSSKHKTLLGF